MLLSIDITGKCNLYCATCYNAEFKRFELNKEDIFNIIDNSLPSLEIDFLGGEPLVRSDILEILIRSVSAGHKTSFCTNGTLLTRVGIEKIVETGVDSISVSLDGASADVNNKIRGLGSFEQCIEGLKKLDRAIDSQGFDIDLCISVTATTTNWKSVVGIPQLLNHLGVTIEKLGVSPVITIGFAGAKPSLKLREDTWIDLCEQLCSTWNSYPKLSFLCLPNAPLIVRYLEKKYSLILPESISDCPILQRRDIGRVMATGEILPCNGRLDLIRKFQESSPGKKRYFISDFAHFSDHPLFDDFIEYFAPYTSLDAEICKTCSYKVDCQVCPLEKFYRTGWRMNREKICSEVLNRIQSPKLENSLFKSTNEFTSDADQKKVLTLNSGIYFKKRRKGQEVLIHPERRQIAILDNGQAVVARALIESQNISQAISSCVKAGLPPTEAVKSVHQSLEVLSEIGVIPKESLT